MAFFDNFISNIPGIIADAGLATIAQGAGQQYDPTGATWKSRLNSLASVLPSAIQANQDRNFYGKMMAANPDFASSYFGGINEMNRTKLAEQEIADKRQKEAARSEALKNLANVLKGGEQSSQGGVSTPALDALFQLDPEMAVKIKAQNELERQLQLSSPEAIKEQQKNQALQNVYGASPVNLPSVGNLAASNDFSSIPPMDQNILTAPYPPMQGGIPTPPMNGMAALAAATGGVQPQPMPVPVPVPVTGQPSALAGNQQLTPSELQQQPVISDLSALAKMSDDASAEAYQHEQKAQAFEALGQVDLAAKERSYADDAMKRASDLRKEALDTQKAQSESAAKVQETEDVKKQRADTFLSTAQEIKTIVIPEIDKAIKILERKGTSGVAGQLGKFIAGTPAFELDAALEPVRSYTGIGKLLEMKAGSSTGASGFGSLSAPELNLLLNSQGSLKVGVSDATLKSTLERMKKSFEKTVDATSKGYEEITGNPLSFEGDNATNIVFPQNDIESEMKRRGLIQ